MVRLFLPLPPSPNSLGGHHHALHRAKRKYQREAWVAAVCQDPPSDPPPARVIVRADFRVRNLRDDDNLSASLKWVLDALRQRQRGKLHWRQGLYDQRGYFVDDDPTHLILSDVSQRIDRKQAGVTLTVTPAPAAQP